MLQNGAVARRLFSLSDDPMLPPFFAWSKCLHPDRLPLPKHQPLLRLFGVRLCVGFRVTEWKSRSVSLSPDLLTGTADWVLTPFWHCSAVLLTPFLQLLFELVGDRRAYSG